MGISVKVTGITDKASLQDIYDFFSFSGPIESINLEKDAEGDVQTAHVTFSEQKSMETALLLTGAMILDKVVIVEPATDYEPPSTAKFYDTSKGEGKETPSSPATNIATAAQEMVRSLLSRGYTLAQDAMQRARDFDARLAISSSAAAGTAAIRDGIVALPSTISEGAKTVGTNVSEGAKVVGSTMAEGAKAVGTTVSEGAKVVGSSVAATADTIDKKLFISQSFKAGTGALAKSLSVVDEKLHLSETTRGAFVAAETKLNEAGEILVQNKLIASSKDFVMGVTSKISNIVEGEAKPSLDAAASTEASTDGSKASKPAEPETEGATKDSAADAPPAALSVDAAADQAAEATKTVADAPAPASKSKEEDTPVF
ncbi:unnamed protein product [Closterium sp. Yama58-4]|nr:unnamed protein product [Closterium sp. Yama58-4]